MCLSANKDISALKSVYSTKLFLGYLPDFAKSQIRLPTYKRSDFATLERRDTDVFSDGCIQNIRV